MDLHLVGNALDVTGALRANRGSIGCGAHLEELVSCVEPRRTGSRGEYGEQEPGGDELGHVEDR